MKTVEDLEYNRIQWSATVFDFFLSCKGADILMLILNVVQQASYSSNPIIAVVWCDFPGASVMQLLKALVASTQIKAW